MARCIDCGFLATRETETRQLAEVDGEFRRTGLPALAIGSGRYYRSARVPVCFAQSVDLQAEILEYQTNSGEVFASSPNDPDRERRLDSFPPERVLELLEVERPLCDSSHAFTKWQQGFTPKEHREMLDRESLLEREREWRSADRSTQEKIAGTAERTVEIARDTATSTKHAAWAQAAAVLVAALGILVAAFCGQSSVPSEVETTATPSAPSTPVSQERPAP